MSPRSAEFMAEARERLEAARALLDRRLRSTRSSSPGSFDPDLARQARATQEPREGVDYAAARVSADEAERIVAVAERFLAAVGEAIDRG